MYVELSCSSVDSVGEVGLDCGEVHGLFDDFEVVEHSVTFGFNWLEEGISAFVFFELGEDIMALCKLVLD
jgi:hypothetical protein